MIGGIIGFFIGCVVWNFFGATIKGWLHIGERAAGQAVRDEAGKLKDDITSRLR